MKDMPRPDDNSPELYTLAHCNNCVEEHIEADEQNSVDWAKEHAGENAGHTVRIRQEVR